MRSKFIRPGAEVLYKNQKAYYERNYGPDQYHLYYFEDEKWPFPKHVVVSRDDFRLKREEKKQSIFEELGEALF